MKQILFVLFATALLAEEPNTRQIIRDLIAKQDYAEALLQAQALNKRMPDDVETYGLLVDANLGLGNYKEAEAAAQWMLDLRIGKADSAGYLRIARVREVFGDLDGAYESAKMAFQRVPPNEPALRVRILAEAGRLSWLAGNTREAEPTLNEALKLDPNYAPALETLARIRIAQKKYDEALALLRRGYQADSQTRLLFTIAETLRKSGDQPGAAQAFAAFEQKAKAEVKQPANANRELIDYFAAVRHQPAAALAIAKEEMTRRHDIATLTAYAGALEQNGQTAEATEVRDRIKKITQ